jgi:hypothetical protein
VIRSAGGQRSGVSGELHRLEVEVEGADDRMHLGAMIGFFFYTTQYLQGVLGFSAFRAGAAFLPMTTVNFAVAMAIPKLTARLGQAIPLSAGVALTLAGMASRASPPAMPGQRPGW